MPAVARGAEGRLSCVRCGTVIGQRPGPETQLAAAAETSRRRSAAQAAVDSGAFLAARAPRSLDAWQLGEQLRHIERVLSGPPFRRAGRDASGSTEANVDSTRIDASPEGQGSRRKRSAAWSRLVGTFVAFGASALAAGIALLTFGALTGRQSLERAGLPVTLLGQVALLIGMVMQLDIVWNRNRETAGKLYSFQKRLVDLEQLASEIAPEGEEIPEAEADDQLVLDDLKSRLDHLSGKLRSVAS